MREHKEMPAAGVIQVLNALHSASLRAWVDGGWGIDALVGEQTRPHKDLELVIDLNEADRVIDVLEEIGYAVTLEERPTRLELHDGEGHKVGLHTVSFLADGGGVQVLPNGKQFLYWSEGFSGRGRIGVVEVACLTADVQVECHLGYEPEEDDFHDMGLLKDRLGIPLPPPYAGDAQG